MHIAVVGCGHGEIDKIYEVIAKIEERQGIKVSVVLCCGDFQSVRNMTDLRCMACPIKYQHMHDFHRYYSGEKKAPILTLFIGGNHEASNFLQELPYGGWVAPNIYYMGYVGVVKVGKLRIAGLSGIYKGQDYLKGRYERPPYDQGTMRSVYHYRNLDIFRLKQLKQHIDIILSHDWPKGIHQYGDFNRLLKQKPFFRDEIERNELGSRPLQEIMEVLQPSYWFSAHMHVKFAACVSHPNTSSESSSTSMSASAVEEEGKAKAEGKTEEDDPVLSNQTSSSVSSSPPSKSDEQQQNIPKRTMFLALDKVLPRRQFLQILEIPSEELDGDQANIFQYDAEWLAILKSTDDLVSSKNKPCFMPGEGYGQRSDFSATAEELEEINTIFKGDLEIKDNFQKTAPAYVEGEQPGRAFPIENPVTKDFCSKVGIVDPLSLLVMPESILQNVDDDVALNEDYADEYDDAQMNITMNTTARTDDSFNPDEISLDMDDDEEDEYGDRVVSSSRSNIAGDSYQRTPTSLPRSRLQLPPPKNGESESSISGNLSSLKMGNNQQSDGFKRTSLVLPPPKNESSSVTADTDNTESERGSETDCSSYFFLDTEGAPNVKRRRNIFD